MASDSSSGSAPASMSSTLKTISQSDRRKLIIVEHRFCTSGMRTAAELVKSDDKDSIAYSYIILRKG
jgi:hypothetical protein